MKTIQRFLTVGLFMAIALLLLLEPAMARNPKIHVLFVWGTNARDTRSFVERSRMTFEEKMDEIDICKGGQYIASFTSLSGDDAHPAKILEHCKKMAQEAGPDDALFVYILCHGASIVLDTEPNNTPYKRIHALSPCATDRFHMNFRSIGIKRSSIIKAMKSTEHRLNVLITDSGSDYTIEMGTARCLCAGFSSFRYLLLNESGTINWGSTNPAGGSDGSGEISIGTRDGTLFMGSFFSHPVQHGMVKGYQRISSEVFFNELGSVLVDDYKYARKIFENDHPILFGLCEQDQQTLTEFDDDGHVIRTWSEKKNRVDKDK